MLPMMQELYLIDTQACGMQRFARSSRHATDVTWSKDSKLILVLWDGSSRTPYQCYKVYSCNGQHLVTFGDPGIYYYQPIAHLPGSRAAIAHATTFEVWDLTEGQLLRTVGPGNIIDALLPDHGLVATNSPCSKLVFSPSQSSTLHVYDAVSLELLSTLLPDACSTSQVSILEQCNRRTDLMGGVYGWLVSHMVFDQSQQLPTVDNVPFADLQPQAGGMRYRMISLKQTSKLFSWLRPSWLSPCGAYICRFDKQTLQIQINDVRSGEIVLRRSLMPAHMHTADIHYQADVCWSSCGFRLMVFVSADRYTPRSHCEQLFIVQFC